MVERQQVLEVQLEKLARSCEATEEKLKAALAEAKVGAWLGLAHCHAGGRCCAAAGAQLLRGRADCVVCDVDSMPCARLRSTAACSNAGKELMVAG
jgi:hypothetical protein